MNASQPIQTSGSLGSLKRYVRVRSEPGSRFVEFDFAIGEPSLFIELVMPLGAFNNFCTANQVVHMSDEQMAQVDAEMEKWRYGEETLMAHNHDRANDLALVTPADQ